MTRVLVIDNYDSFVYTLNGYLQQLGAETTVVRNDELTVGELEQMLADHDGVLISPGPGTPADAGVSISMVHLAMRTGMPLLGVCLGHQAIAEAMGATVTHAEELMHGKVSRVTHSGDSFFAGVAEEFQATRYHSLAVVRDTVPVELAITAETASGIRAVDADTVEITLDHPLKRIAQAPLSYGGRARQERSAQREFDGAELPWIKRGQ